MPVLDASSPLQARPVSGKDALKASAPENAGALEAQMGVSINGGTPKSSIFVGFSLINHPFWDTTMLSVHGITSFNQLNTVTIL